METRLTFVRTEEGIKFYGEISDLDIAKLNLDAFYQGLTDDLRHNDRTTNELLVIEMLFRKIAENSKPKLKMKEQP